MKKVLISILEPDSPNLYLEGFGVISLIDFYSNQSDFYQREADHLYSSADLRTGFRRVDMDEKDLEMIKEFAKNRKGIIPSQINDFKEKLRIKYSLYIPEEAEV